MEEDEPSGVNEVANCFCSIRFIYRIDSNSFLFGPLNENSSLVFFYLATLLYSTVYMLRLCICCLPVRLSQEGLSNLGRPASPPLTAENNYATKSPLVTMGCPYLPSKLPFPLRLSPPPSYTPISRSTPLTTPNGIRIQSAVLPQYTFRTQTDRQMR